MAIICDKQKVGGELTIAAHTQSKTFLQPAVLTAVTVGPVNKTVPLS